MKTTFLNTIHIGKYQEAKQLTQEMNLENLTQFLIDLSIETGSINIYAFVCFLLAEQESIIMHSCATGILNHGICFFEGATSAALFHARRMAELAPQNIAYKVELLHYFGMPEQVISRKEAKDIAHKILIQDPHNSVALQTIEDINSVEKHEQA